MLRHPTTHYRSTVARPPRFIRHPMALTAHLLVAGSIAASVGWISHAHAQQPAPVPESQADAASLRSYNIPAGPLNTVLMRFVSESGLLLSGSAEFAQGRNSPGVQGHFTPGAALSALLTGTGLDAVPDARGKYLLQEVSVPTSLPPINVSANSLGETTEGSGSYTTGLASTATKLNLSHRETPQSVSVITRQNMDDQYMVSIEDAMRNTPGVYTNMTSTERSSFYSRGFRITNITYDGLTTNLDTSDYGGDVLLSDLVIYDRVEIVRGATGLTHGAGNPGAAVNLVRKRPTHNLVASVTGTAGNWNRYGVETDISGALTAGKSLRGRLVASYRDEDSYQDEVTHDRKVLYGIIECRFD